MTTKRIAISLGLAALLAAVPALADEGKSNQPAPRKPSGQADAPEHTKADGPKHPGPGPGPGQFPRNRTEIEQRHGEVQRLMREGQYEEAHRHVDEMKREADQFKAEADKLRQAQRFESLEKSVQSLAKQLEAVSAELKRRGS